MSDCFVLYLLLTCMKKKTSGADKFTNNNEIISEYEKAKDKSNEKARESAEKHHGNPDKDKDKEATPFR